jgi:hypothetical protein
MKKLRKLGAIVSMTFALGISVMAAEDPPLPCGSTEPGQIPTPPCAMQLATENVNTAVGASSAPGDIATLAAANETSLTRIAADVLLNFLPLF